MSTQDMVTESVDAAQNLGNEVVAGTPAAAPETATESVAEASPETPRGDDGRFIPKARMDEQVGKERAAREMAERRAEELELRLGQVARAEDVEKIEGHIQALEQQHAKLLMDGDAAQAAEAMRQIRLNERRIAIQEAQTMSASSRDQAREEMRIELTVERLEARYDSINPRHETYDQAVVDDVLGWQQVYMQRDRLAPSQALIKAAEKVISAQTAVSPGDKPGLGAAQNADRREEQLRKNLSAQKAQAPGMSQVGMDSDKAGVKADLDLTRLSADEYDALPEATKAKLRGDFA